VRQVGFRDPLRDLESPVLTALALSPDLGRIAVGGDDHRLHLFDLNDGRVLGRLSGSVDWVRAVAFLDDQSVAAVGDDGCLRAWDLASGRLLYERRLTGTVLYALVRVPGAGRLATGGPDGLVHLVDERTGQELQRLAAADDEVRALAASPDGKRLAAAGRDGRIRQWTFLGPRAAPLDLPGHTQRVRALAYSPDGSRLASAGDDRQVRIWVPDTGASALVLPLCPAKFHSLAFCGPDRIAAGGSDNLIRLFQLSTGVELQQLVGHRGSVAALGFAPGPGLLVSGAFDTTACVWTIGDETRAADATSPFGTRIGAIPTSTGPASSK
jgi:WD40 repeat protein